MSWRILQVWQVTPLWNEVGSRTCLARLVARGTSMSLRSIIGGKWFEASGNKKVSEIWDSLDEDKQVLGIRNCMLKCNRTITQVGTKWSIQLYFSTDLLHFTEKSDFSYLHIVLRNKNVGIQFKIDLNWLRAQVPQIFNTRVVFNVQYGNFNVRVNVEVLRI